MREMTIEEAHEIALDIMKEIHDFCMSNDIKYSLAYGSLIGAIRHQGFVPWDDDIDIWMTRPNFEKFTKSFSSKRGYRLSSIYDEDSLICFNRVYEIQKTYVKGDLKSCDGNTGIWVDIMPLDGVPDDIIERNNQYQSFCHLISELKDYRAWSHFLEHGGGKYQTYIVTRMLLRRARKGNLFQLTRSRAYNNHKEMISLSQKYEFGKSTYCCYLQCGDAFRKNKQELLPTSDFSEYEQVPFEGERMMIIKGYDKLLRSIYGNYMELPPVEARYKSHGVCFWL